MVRTETAKSSMVYRDQNQRLQPGGLGGKSRQRFIIEGLLLLVILVLGGWMRLTAIDETRVPRPLGPDAWQYFNYAYNLLHHGTFSKDPSVRTGASPIPDAFRTPGYPLFLVPFLSQVTDPSWITRVEVVQAWLGTVSLGLVFILARTFLPWVLAGVATLLSAITPHLITMNHYILSESLFAFLLLVTLTFMVLSATRWWGWLGVGMLLCATGMVRPVAFYWLLPTALLLWFRRSLPGRKRATLALIIGFFVVMIPWMVRNKITLGVWSDDTFVNQAIAFGIYPDFTYNQDPNTFAYPYRFDPRVEEIIASRAAVMRELWDKLTHDTVRYLQWYFVSKPIWFWSWGIIQGQGDAFIYQVTESPYYDRPWFRGTHHFMLAIHGMMVVLAGLGSIMIWLPSRWRPDMDEHALFMARMLSLLLFFMTAAHMAVPPYPRYNIPLRPELYCMSLFFLWTFHRQTARWLQPCHGVTIQIPPVRSD
ncbi:MAG: hypothetical protein HQL73_07255 [Magnetococcales bacterium]|nr:hypothetical protein [Magnetococcales bacterium]